MPCSDGGYTQEQLEQQRKEARKNDPEAMLCSALTYLENHELYEDFLKEHDVKESGIPLANLKRWWKKHKKQDTARKRMEEQRDAERIKELEDELLKYKTWRISL